VESVWPVAIETVSGVPIFCPVVSENAVIVTLSVLGTN
jgi:hypothetical protein